MLKKMAVVLAGALLLLTACQKAEPPAPEAIAELYMRPIEAQATIEYEGKSAAAKISRTPTEFTLKFEQEGPLDGMEFVLKHEGCVLKYGELEKELAASALPETGAPAQLSAALDSLSRAQGLETSLCGGKAEVSGRIGSGAFVLIAEPETLVPCVLKLAGDIEVSFSGCVFG